MTKNSGKMGTATSSNIMGCRQQYNNCTPWAAQLLWLTSWVFFIFWLTCGEQNFCCKTAAYSRYTEKWKKILNFADGLRRCYLMGSPGFLRISSARNASISPAFWRNRFLTVLVHTVDLVVCPVFHWYMVLFVGSFHPTSLISLRCPISALMSASSLRGSPL